VQCRLPSPVDWGYIDSIIISLEGNLVPMNEITKLPADRWREYRELRLSVLQSDPVAFGSSYEEESVLAEEVWRQKINNALFILSEGKPVGMVVIICSEKRKTRHVAHIFSFLVVAEFRRQGLGDRLLSNALAVIPDNPNIRKIRLEVNTSQAGALRLYEKHGFVCVGTLKDELLVDGLFYDELIMEKRVSP
jgi:ribosomal protein S18 acetylase RimI-like enzyme